MFVKQIWFRCYLEQALTEAGKTVRELKEDVHADFKKVVSIPEDHKELKIGHEGIAKKHAVPSPGRTFRK